MTSGDNKDSTLDLDYGKDASPRFVEAVEMYSSPEAYELHLTEFKIGKTQMTLYGNTITMASQSLFMADRLDKITQKLMKDPEHSFSIFDHVDITLSPKSLLTIWIYLNGTHRDGDMYYDSMTPMEILRILGWLDLLDINPKNPIYSRCLNKMINEFKNLEKVLSENDVTEIKQVIEAISKVDGKKFEITEPNFRPVKQLYNTLKESLEKIIST